MSQFSNKNGAKSAREPTAAEVREAARSDAAPRPATTTEQPKRRRFAAEYKRRILREADEALASGVDGAVGALLRREGLYSSHLTSWRKQRERGELAGLAPKKRGRKAVAKNPLAAEVERLRRENTRLQAELEKAKVIIDVQKKVAALLGNPIPDEPTEGK